MGSVSIKLRFSLTLEYCVSATTLKGECKKIFKNQENAHCGLRVNIDNSDNPGKTMISEAVCTAYLLKLSKIINFLGAQWSTFVLFGKCIFIMRNYVGLKKKQHSGHSLTVSH